MLFHKKFDYGVVIFRLMRESTVVTAFNRFTVEFNVLWISRTMLFKIKRAIAKQTVKIFDSLMTRVVFTCFICKISWTIFHKKSPVSLDIIDVYDYIIRYLESAVLKSIKFILLKPKHLFAFFAALCYHNFRKTKVCLGGNIWHTEKSLKNSLRF